MLGSVLVVVHSSDQTIAYLPKPMDATYVLGAGLLVVLVVVHSPSVQASGRRPFPHRSSPNLAFFGTGGG